MQCAACGFSNPAAAKFCQECGARGVLVCSGCATELPQGAKFCHECGQQTAAAETTAPAPEREAAIPEAFASGRYRIVRFVGEGAKKRVYQAHDERLDRDVALAIIKSDGLDEAGRLRIRHEAQAMARLGDHPNIVTVHDIGEENSQIYLVGQFMAGGDLEHARLQRADQRRLEIEESVRIARELCSALDHAHTRGVVHRDVKPGNIWLTEDGTAKLGDFGLALAIDRTRLTQDGMMVGTAAYMAPEQALGRPPDARSDLYSLGATLYEMLTGRPPFLGDDVVAIVSQHINTRPVAPTWHRAEVPKPLETLVLELLEKDPTRRPDTASATRQRLERAVSRSAERLEVTGEAEANPLDRLASGVFVGREEQLEILHRALEDTLSGKGRVLLLVGEPGIGKTRTSEELTTYARMRGAQVLWGRCYEGDGAPSYWPWMQVIRSYAHDRDPKELLSEMGPGAADIAEVVSEVREHLPGLPAPPVLEAEQARFRLFDSITTFLKNASRRQPIVLVLDDLHWADRPSLLLLEFLARELDPSRILVLGTYRDVEVGRQHPLEQTLAELARVQRAERVLLRGLTLDDVMRFVELTAGRTPPPSLTEAVYRETEGNPFFVHEVVRLLQADGRLDHPEAVESWSVEIPQGVRQVIGRRLDALSEECNRLLTLASAIGRDFELRVLAGVAEVEEDTALELIEQAEDARVIGEVEEAPGWYRFSHALVRETLYEEIRTTRRVRLHRRIAEVLEERYAGRLGPHLAELAYHYCEAASGGDVDKAVEYAERAAHRAAESLAFEEAANHYDRALMAFEADPHPDEQRRCQLLLARGDALYRAGQPDQARQVFNDGIAVARTLSNPAYLGIAVVGTLRAPVPPGVTDPDEIVLIHEALDRLGEGTPGLRARLLTRLAGRYIWLGETEKSRAAGFEAIGIVGEGGSLELQLEERQEVEAARSMLFGREKIEERIAGARETLALAIRAGRRGSEFHVRGNLFLWYSFLGNREAAIRELAAYRQIAAELRQPSFEFNALRAQALQDVSDGRLVDAREHSWKGRAAGMRVDATTAEIVFGSVVYTLRRMQGRFAETEEALRAGVVAYPGALVWSNLLACMLAETGRPEEAREILDRQHQEGFASLRGIPFGSDDSYGLLADVCVATEHVAAAESLYELLLPARDHMLWSGFTIAHGAAARSLGNLASVLGRWVDAEQHFERAVALEAGFGARGFLPRTQCDYARMLLARNEPGDRAGALDLLDGALATSQELGLKGWLDRCLETKLEVQGVDSGATQGTIHSIASSIGSRRPDLAPHSAPDGTVTLMFSDMEGFTAMTERLGDLRAREVIRDHNQIVREQVAAHGGHEVELQGDGFLIAFGSARRGLQCAMAVQRAFAAYSADHEDTPIRVRIGLHTGEALRERDKFFGRTVILAARIAAEARGGEILVSALLKELTQSLGDLEFGSGRQVPLKGISEVQSLFAVEWRSPKSAASRHDG
jgi:class 3 adenylate cyclase